MADPRGSLFDLVRTAVREDRFMVGWHANERLRDRGIRVWQVVEGVEGAKLTRTRPDATPNSAVELEQVLADGTPVKAVWAWLPRAKQAKLITVHFFDR